MADAAPPTPSHTQEYINEDKGPTIVITAWLVTAIATLFVLARLAVRGKIHGKLEADDYFVAVSLACGYISTGLSTEAVKWGNGRHFDILTLEQKSNVIKWTTAAFCPGILSFALPKMAVIVLLTRLLNPGKFHKAFLWGIGLLCNASLIATCGVLLGRCTPIESTWNFSVPGTCFGVDILINYAIYAGSLSVFCDMYLAIYPTFVLFKLQLPLKKKIALSIALGIGIASAAVATYKCTRLVSVGSADYSYETADLVIWTVIEGSTIIIACTIPVLQPLMDVLLRFVGARQPKSSQRYYEDYSSNSRQNIELGQRKAKLRDDLGFTVVNEDESQENILTDEKNGSVRATAQPVTIRPDSVMPSDGTIMRTDAVTLSYEEKNNKNTNNGGKDRMSPF